MLNKRLQISNVLIEASLPRGGLAPAMTTAIVGQYAKGLGQGGYDEIPGGMINPGTVNQYQSVLSVTCDLVVQIDVVYSYQWHSSLLAHSQIRVLYVVYSFVSSP